MRLFLEESRIIKFPSISHILPLIDNQKDTSFIPTECVRMVRGNC